MAILDLIKKTRSHRSYKNITVPEEVFLQILEGAHYSSAGANKQLLKYFIVNDPETCKKLFTDVVWASQIQWKPVLEEAPGGYIIILTDNPAKIPANFIYADCGIAIQNMRLIATELGYGTNIMEPVKKDEILKTLKISESYTPLFVIPLGVPTDEIVLTEVKNEDMKYWRESLGDHQYRHYVPKLDLNELILGKKLSIG